MILLMEKLALGPRYVPHLSRRLTPGDLSLELLSPPVLSSTVVGMWPGSHLSPDLCRVSRGMVLELDK